MFCHKKGGWSFEILYLSKNNWNPTDDQTFSMTLSLDSFTAEAVAFRASVYRDWKSDDNVASSKALNAFVFARIASLTPLFHQDVFFLLSPVALSRFRTQLSAANEMIILCCTAYFQPILYQSIEFTSVRPQQAKTIVTCVHIF